MWSYDGKVVNSQNIMVRQAQSELPKVKQMFKQIISPAEERKSSKPDGGYKANYLRMIWTSISDKRRSNIEKYYRLKRAKTVGCCGNVYKDSRPAADPSPGPLAQSPNIKYGRERRKGHVQQRTVNRPPNLTPVARKYMVQYEAQTSAIDAVPQLPDCSKDSYKEEENRDSVVDLITYERSDFVESATSFEACTSPTAFSGSSETGGTELLESFRSHIPSILVEGCKSTNGKREHNTYQNKKLDEDAGDDAKVRTETGQEKRHVSRTGSSRQGRDQLTSGSCPIMVPEIHQHQHTLSQYNRRANSASAILLHVKEKDLPSFRDVQRKSTGVSPQRRSGPKITVGISRTSRVSLVHLQTSQEEESELKQLPLQRFKRAVRTIQVLLKATTSSRRDQQRSEAKLLSFSQFQDELAQQRRGYGDTGLTFDRMFYKAHRETQISNEAKEILSMDPSERSEDQLHVALVSLNQAVEAFSEFPINMQRSLVRVGWYEHFESKRIIIRQLHTADNFYLILSGTAIVTVLDTNAKTGESYVRTVAFLGKGNSFGELALMHGGKRTATVTCKDDVELLAVGREDFIDIFMHVEKDHEPEHIQFLRQVDLLKGWPTERLPWNNPKICLFTYFRRGVVMCRDSNKADWVYIIKTGSCKVLKGLQATTPNIPGLVQQQYSKDTITQGMLPPRSRIMRSPGSSMSNFGANSSLFKLFDGISPPPTGRSTPRSSRGLPPLTPRTHDEINKSNEQHHKKIDKLYVEKHPAAETVDNERRKNDEIEAPKAKPEIIFVQVQKLGPKDTFGLEHIAFSLVGGCTSVSLVSDGAEAVLINKRFFLQHLTDDVQKILRQTIQPYPSEESLQQKLQDQANWEAYKSMTVNDHMLYRRYVQDTLYL